MKFTFKIQSYQTDAVEAVCKAFQGQRYQEHSLYIRDLGMKQPIAMPANQQMEFALPDRQISLFEAEDDTGYRNASLTISDGQLLNNIRAIQQRSNIRQSGSLVKDVGVPALDVEMETGTGKTYVYIKTMYELHRRYGWGKFIIVVPSIAIREGVMKSFQMTEDHFMEQYGHKVRSFIYSSSDLHQLDTFSSGSGIHAMIINTQAFAASLKEGGRSKESRIIYDIRDEFGSRRPIDVIAANQPIIIRDEPQKMGGEVTQAALKRFNPLFTLNYSATHKKEHNLVYVLDALDAYNKRLVKKIEVKGFEVRNLRGTGQYLYLESFVLSSNKPPRVRLEFEVAQANGAKRKTRILEQGDNLYHLSGNMQQYQDGYTISFIDPIRDEVTFLNGLVLRKGDVVGDTSEKAMRRVQIRETILSHFEKEEKLFHQGIKTLSLFFIDEVAKYRQYDEDGQELLGEYGRMFEEEYINILNDYIQLFDTPYQAFLKRDQVQDVHKGYFSIDKKTRRSVDSAVRRGSDISDDISAYDLILKNKERLLSFEEKTRFIFSHSALREGWDNPNVFQICTLKSSDSTTTKRQEVGRGLRICVNHTGARMDADTLGDSVHDINKLTVIASESYKDFVGDLQKQIREELYDRPTKASPEYFTGKTVTFADDTKQLSDKDALEIYIYLRMNGYVDKNDGVSDAYRADLANKNLAELPEELRPYGVDIHTLIQGIFDESVLDKMVEDGNRTKLRSNPLNDNFYKKEFQTLWNYINRKYVYTVQFDSDELIKKAIAALDSSLTVTPLQYSVTLGVQQEQMDHHALERGEGFVAEKTKIQALRQGGGTSLKYDLVGKLAQGTTLTRRTVATILGGIQRATLSLFKENPEEFIAKAIRLIEEQKATMIVEHISYNQTEDSYDSTIFTLEKSAQRFDQAFKAKKHIQDYVFTDGYAEQSVERRFAEDMDLAEEVCVYAKLPLGFQIPTPVGNYSPDWAIAFHQGMVKHIYFIAETKGSMESMQLRAIEKAKVACARKHFLSISTNQVKYDVVSSYQDLMEKVMV